MGDSDDDFESNLNKRRGQSRNKFRNERDDFMKNNNFGDMAMNDHSNNELKRKERDFNINNNNNNNSRYQPPNNRRHNFESNNFGEGFRNNSFDRPFIYPNSRNRGPNPMDRSMAPSNMRHNNHVQHGDFLRHNDDEFRMGGFNKRHNPSSPSYDHPPGQPMMPPNVNYFNPNIDRNSPSFYENQHSHHSSAKKQKRDWSVLDGPVPPSNYYEHDNRLGPDYDEFGDEYNDDYNRLNRPPNYPSYRYENNSSMSSSYSTQSLHSSSSSSNNFSNNINYQLMNNNNNNNNNKNPNFNPLAAAQAILSQVAPILNNPNVMQNNFFNNKQNMNNFSNNVNNNGNLNINQNNNPHTTETQPQMLSFKQFLSQLNNEMNGNVSNEIANKRYNDYKIQFRKDQVQAFFDAHKHEEWFKYRYHPEESTKRKEEQRESIQKRLKLFLAMLEKFDLKGEDFKFSLEMTDESCKSNLNRFIDCCLIKLEDGTDEDVEKLEKYYDKMINNPIKNGNNENKQVKLEKINENEDEKNKEQDIIKDDNNSKREATTTEETEVGKQETIPKENDSKQEDNIDLEFIQSLPHKTHSIFFKHLPVIVTRQDLEKIGSKYEGFKRASISEPAPERRFQRRGWITFMGTFNIKDLCSKINGTRLYDMQLNAAINRETDQKIKCISGLSNHRDIVRNDLKLICKVVENMDKRWGLWQHKFVLYNQLKNTTNGIDNNEEIKQEKSDETNGSSPQQPKINNELQDEKIETNECNPLLLEALKYLENLEEIMKLEKSKLEEESDKKQQQDEISSTKCEESKLVENTKIENNQDTIQTDLNTATSGEEIVTTTVEDDLSKEIINDKTSKNENQETKSTEIKEKTKMISTSTNKIVQLEKDEKATFLLDRLILYLRLVHSIDYYNASEYQQEDFMPSRCGVLHVRGSSQVKNNSSIINIINGVNVNYYDPDSIKKLQIDEWNRLFDIHIKSYSDYHDRVDLETAKRLGLKDVKIEIEKFINSNCQQMDKNIWLCPLSGKKFKGPDYVKKHIETKHAEKLVEVEKEVDYFNRFVTDPKRPYLPEHPFTKNNQQNQMMMQNNYPMMSNNSHSGYQSGPYQGYNDHYNNQNNRFSNNNSQYSNQIFNQPYSNKNFNSMPSHYQNDNYHHNFSNQSRGSGYNYDQPHYNHNQKVSRR